MYPIMKSSVSIPFSFEQILMLASLHMYVNHYLTDKQPFCIESRTECKNVVKLNKYKLLSVYFYKITCEILGNA